MIPTKWPLEKSHLRIDIAVGKERKSSKARKEQQGYEEAVGTWKKGQGVLSAETLDKNITRLLTNFCMRTISQERHMPHNIPRRVRKLDPDAYTATEFRNSFHP